MRRFAFAMLAATSLALPLAAKDKAPETPSAVAGAEAQEGLLRVFTDRKAGKVFIELPPPDADGVSGRFIYTAALETGLGSAPIGLDLSAPKGTQILAFRRLGQAVVAEIENPRFVASSGTPAERASVRRAFATSTLWQGKVAEERPGGGVLVELTDFTLRDDMGIARAIQQGGGGTFKYAPNLSAFDPASVKVFPGNIELTSRLTFTSDDPQAEVSNIAPEYGNVTLLVRRSLVRLPEPGFVPRAYDPRAGGFAQQVIDFSTPIDRSPVRQLAMKFRLEKTDPAAARSPVKEPIVFYIDGGAPEPVRSALVDGVGWWAQAFDEAGLVDAFRVAVLPSEADPQDIRYNVVNWVNRATRGWSFGAPLTDPRTGEILKGAVVLGSLRVRQDMMIFQALVGAGLTGTGDPNDPVTASLARIRQLGAHEVGHTLGFEHNYASSTQGRYSVMDYPAPRVALTPDGRIDLSDAYGSGIGEWDKFAVKWLYGAQTQEEADRVMAEGRAKGLRLVTDGESRSADGAHPEGGLWDDGGDSVAELARVLAVRQAALARFGADAIPAGEDSSALRRAFVPIWLLHRYQVEAAAKKIGGVYFDYSLAGDGTEPARVVAASEQRAALDAVVGTLDAKVLAVPARLVPLLTSGANGEADRQTQIEVMGTTGPGVFDPLGAAETAAAVTLQFLFAPGRLDRLENQSRAYPGVPGALEVVDAAIEKAFAVNGLSEADAAVQRRIATTTAFAAVRLQRDKALSPTLSLALADRLSRLATRLSATAGAGEGAAWARGLGALLSDNEALDRAVSSGMFQPSIPPGSPI
ncbi:zinc-dependent metalloprotease [Tsuneonella sp. HG222]